MIEVLAARESWCRPDESILWCLPLESKPGRMPYILYQVRGLDDSGNRKGALAGRALSAVGRGAAAFALNAIGPSDEGSSSTPEPAFTVVSGADHNCLAVQRLAEWQPTNQDKTDRNPLWVLTTQRLGLLEMKQPARGNPTGAMRGLWGRSGGEVQATELPDVKVMAEIPRVEISALDVVKYRLGSSECTFLRLPLADGSTIDISDSHHRRRAERMLAMSRGQE